jgi:hypothetical protein
LISKISEKRFIKDRRLRFSGFAWLDQKIAN